MRIVGGIDALSNWSNPIKLKYDEKKVITAKDGNKIEGFWNITFLLNSQNRNNYNFEYRYTTYDEKTKTAIWEREPNRHIHILTEINNDNYSNYNNNPDEYKLLANSFLQILDVNFVADFIFNKMGEKNIFIGPYPQNKDDLVLLSKSNINTILNVQSDGDLRYRQINLDLLRSQAKELGMELYHYPINDFDSHDLSHKLKGAGDLLNDLLKKGKVVYVHCTAGMSRAAATVIIYLVIYEDYNVESAKNFCKKYRPVICPNYQVINKIARKYKPGSEMWNNDDSNTNMNEVWKKLREAYIPNISTNNKGKNDDYNIIRPLASTENISKNRKTKSKRKKRLKSILKPSLRRENSQDMKNLNKNEFGLKHSITFILDNEIEGNLDKKISEKLPVRSKLNLEKNEMNLVKKKFIFRNAK